MPDSSPFLDRPQTDHVAANALAFAIRDGFPVSEGHTLIIPRRLVATWFEASRAEQLAILDLIDDVKRDLDRLYRPDGYNIGINAGAAAGQTVMHLHVHVIPRHTGDVADPRGGVRHVIPGKGNYLAVRPAPLVVGGAEDHFLAHVRPLIAQASHIDILAAFVQDSGLELLESALQRAVRRGAHVRVVTGDYLHITQERALVRLLDWMLGSAARDDEMSDDMEEVSAQAGSFEAGIVETARLMGSRAFHPKSWIFLRSNDPETGAPAIASAFVGSSNISRSALTDGVEWNLRVDRARDPVAFDQVAGAFADCWLRARPLDPAWVAGYRERVRLGDESMPIGEVATEPVPVAFEPHELQAEALGALADAREKGTARALVVLATGLGKTWLAAFDVAALADVAARPLRVLFLAHRHEILQQAATTFRRQFAAATIGFFGGARADLDADFVFASVQKLGRPANLARLPVDRFDYVVIDEVHHAAAATYRRILGHLEPRFLLGLTATPDRADEADILGLFDDNLVFRADLGVGIEVGRLVPFAYFGLKDTTDYAPIPWRNRRFDPGELARAVQTQARMERLWDGWKAHPGTRTLVFCCSIGHANWVSRWLADRGVRNVSVHSGADSVDRDEALAQLAAGTLDAVCSVDLFNEGVDLPAVDRVVMLRPTESPVLFLQQLGRGLRVAAGKTRLTVIDFVGNHRVFLDRVRTLLSFGAHSEHGSSLAGFLTARQRAVPADSLPPGCSVDIELEAVDMLRLLLPGGARNALVRAYRELRASRGVRPTAGELYRLGYNPASVRSQGGWLAFVADEDDLDAQEAQALAAATGWFRDLETTQLSKSFKMVTLQALIEADALASGLEVGALARRSHGILLRSPELFVDIADVRDFDDPRAPDAAVWRSYWSRNPLHFWSTANRTTPRPWFTLDGGAFVPRYSTPLGCEDAFAALTLELVDWRLAQYRRRRRDELTAGARAFECRVFHNDAGPILKLPDRARFASIPLGETDVRLPDGAWWRFRFVKIAVNVAHPVGSARNHLPDLMRRFFGPDAGRSGTDFRVRFVPSPDGWNLEPLTSDDAQVIPLPERGRLIAWPELRIAAGASSQGRDAEGVEPEPVALPGTFAADAFAVRASGSSMQGWRSEIRDGDWLVMRWARGLGLSAVQGRIVLLGRGGADDRRWHLKRVVRRDDGWWFASDNPDVTPLTPSPDDEIVALLDRCVRPESLAPDVGSTWSAGEVAAAFGVEHAPVAPLERIDGHLFVVLSGSGAMSAPDRFRVIVQDRRPGETAFVLERLDGDRFGYLGLARWLDSEGEWTIQDVDFATWRRLGTGRSASRRLAPHLLQVATALADGLLLDPGPMAWVGPAERRCRIVGKAHAGGIRIDGGEGGFGERTVSLVDLAWAVAARRVAADQGAVADEGLLNRLRYLEGTPKGSTRWVDSGWALVLVGEGLRHTP